jgi:hypothetical protein
VSQYEPHPGDPDSGDLCRLPSNSYECPLGCVATEGSDAAPYCVMAPGPAGNSLPCHLDVGGVVSSGGGECLYVAEPMTYATAERRCAAEYPNGGVCDLSQVNLGDSTIDGQSSDWQAVGRPTTMWFTGCIPPACALKMLCSRRVPVFAPVCAPVCAPV